MPVHHEIDNDIKLITTIWSGEAADNELIDSLSRYQQDIRSQPDYYSYDEILDFSNAANFNLSTEGIKKLAKIAASSDSEKIKSKLAIIVSQPFAFGLARMYETYRSLLPGVKEVRIFRNYRDARDWLKV
jgi:hypothetical protein